MRRLHYDTISKLAHQEAALQRGIKELEVANLHDRALVEGGLTALEAQIIASHRTLHMTRAYQDHSVVSQMANDGLTATLNTARLVVEAKAAEIAEAMAARYQMPNDQAFE